MKSVPLLCLVMPLLAAVGMAGVTAHAQQRSPERSEQFAMRGGEDAATRSQRRQDSMADSIRHVRRSNRGHIIAADRMLSNGRQINRIKLVDYRGRVRVIEDDPQRRRAQRSRRDDD